ncbi:MAG: xanthine dehydrogenase family protein molybdopterin-binding subunit [Gammaproteobacteria bacterium]
MLHGIGKPVRRKEDRRLVTGNGRYTADTTFPDQAYLVVYRSPVAHASINAIDTSAARAAAGVIAVFTAKELMADGAKNLPCEWPAINKDGSPMIEPVHPLLATNKMVYCGEPIAVVIAESRDLAKDAAELIELDYDELPVVPSAVEALKPGAPLVWDNAPGNLACDWAYGDKEATDKAFERAAHVVEMDAVQNRLVANPMEPRAANAIYDIGKDDYTIYISSQTPHLHRYLACNKIMGIPEHKLRVIAPDVGGGFGAKTSMYAEEHLCLFGAKLAGRPVKWVCERSETFVTDAQARDHVTHAELALDENGKMLGVRSYHVADLGPYCLLFGPIIPTAVYSTILCGVYTIPAMYSEAKLAFSNTTPTSAYRGAGRPEAIYTIERLVDLAAEKLGMDPDELRRQNFIPKNAFPYATAAGMVYDQSDYHQCLDLAQQLIDFDGFSARRGASKARGRLRGIGIGVYIEHAGLGPSQESIEQGARIAFYESATVRVNPDATVTVLTGAHSHGQGHETTFAQVVADKLHVPFEDVDVVYGDTGRVPYGVGTYASRSMVTAGSAAVMGVNKVIAKGKLIAAHVLEADVDEIEYIEGFFKVKDSDRIMAFKDMVHLAYLPGNYPIETLEPGLEEVSWFDPPETTFPAGCHICEVEIDPDTGCVELVDYSVADDVGVVINPMIVHGQVHGGVVQGIGQALFENTVYDTDTGQLVTGSFLDYCMPRADNLPMLKVDTIDNATPTNPLGAKGCGEGGSVGAPAAVMNAIFDALKPAGVTDLTMPATAHKIWMAIDRASKS